MTEERTERRRLCIDDVKQLQEYDAPVNSNRWHARNLWLLSFFGGGLRASDAISLEWASIDGQTLHFIMGKTKKPYRIELLPQALNIINLHAHRRSRHKYVFPLLSDDVKREDYLIFRQAVGAKCALVNANLAVIAGHLGIPKFSTHTARHSIADYMRVRGLSIYSISKLLRHANLQITEQYLQAFDGDSVSKEFAKAFEEAKQ
jgi:integrase